MKSIILFTILIAFTVCFITDIKSSSQGCYKRSDTPVMGTDRANYKLLSKEELPETWEWSNINGTNFLTLGRNQHIPEYCGSCWAFSATSAVSDRIKIMRNAQWPDISISPQVLLSCSNKDDGCHGGEMMTAYEYMYRYNITDETCSSYQALGRDNGLPCSKQVICKNCSGLGASTKCWEQETYRSYTVTEFAEISGELAMMNEIKARGPITCAIAVPKSLFEYKDGVYVDKTGAKTQTHGISVVGWGVENGTPYWLVRNSWGESWGIHGFFKVIRGVDNIGIEEQCSYAVPKDTWTEADKQQEEKVKKQEQTGNLRNTPRAQQISQSTCTRIQDQSVEQKIITQQPFEYINVQDLPANYDWRNIDGVNYLSWTVNQHIPVYCGSCWAQAVASSIADRYNIVRKNAWPQSALAVQTIINCKAGGSCNGGNPLGAYEFAHTEGVPVVTCQQYIAKNPQQFSCSEIQKCMDCIPPAYPDSTCNAIKEYPRIKVSQYGSVSGVEKMKAEIYARGPISCGICVTNAFEEYEGGIFSQHLTIPPELMINHEIAVVGWGEENGEQYWIGRNSWGTYWGEQGFFRIKMDGDNLGINSQCSWGEVLVE